MKEINPVYNYTLQEEGEFTKFVYKKSPISYKMAGPVCVYTFIPAALLVFFFFNVPSMGAGVVTWLLMTVALSFATVFALNQLRKPGEFKIGKAALIVDNKTYQLSHVSSFLIKDPFGAYSSETTTIIVNNHSTNLVGTVGKISSGMGQTSRESRRAIQQALNEVGYKIMIRYGSKDIQIASSLSETDAEILFDKVTNVAGYTSKGN